MEVPWERKGSGQYGEKDEEAARGSLHFSASLGRNLVGALDGYTEVLQ